MSDDQLAALFIVERDGEGNALIKPPALGGPPSARQAFESRCFLCGITDGQKVADLWAAQQARREAENPKDKKRRRR